MDFDVVDITDKKTIKCPSCGETLKIPPRTFGTRELKHLQDVEQLEEWKKEKISADVHEFLNVRVLLCQECGRPVICRDKFSSLG